MYMRVTLHTMVCVREVSVNQHRLLLQSDAQSDVQANRPSGIDTRNSVDAEDVDGGEL